jgi:hypothetical protein
MGESLIDEFLSGDSKEVRDLANNEALLVGFLTLTKGVDDLPGTATRFYEEPRSLYQVTSSGHSIDELMAILSDFFGVPAKPPGKALPVNLRFDPTVKFLGGIRKDQALFLKNIDTGAFYGALWPWQRDADKIEILLGFCSASMRSDDYRQLETLVHKFLSKKKIETISGVGGQIHGISLPSFLQMSEMEGATYTLEVTSGKRSGHLYLHDGSLIAASYADQTGNTAAYRIISWDNVAIQIQAADPDREREIHDPLMHVMMESLKIKDEADAAPEPPSPATEPPTASAPPPPQQAEAQPEAADAKRAPESSQQEPVTTADPKPLPLQPEVAAPFEKAYDQSVGKQAQMSRTHKLLIVLGVVILFAVSVTVGGKVLKKRQINRRYDRLIADLAATKELDAQVVLLMRYIKSHPDDVHLPELEDRLEKTNTEIERLDYEKTILDVNRLPVDEKYEKKALSLYTAFLAKHPRSPYAKQINESIAGIRQLLGTAYFEDLEKVSTSGLLDRHTAYRAYLEQFPQGAERGAVERMISDLAQEYYASIDKQTATCDDQENWDACIAECDRFLSIFTDDVLAERVTALRSELQDKKALMALTAKANRVADDLVQAKRVYSDYLDNHPNTTQKAVIRQRIDGLEAELAKQSAWEKTAAYATNPKIDIFRRIQRLDAYIQNHASGSYNILANELRAQLTPELDKAIRAQRAEEKRQQTLARTKVEQNRRAEAVKRIRRLQEQVAKQLQPVSTRFVDNQNGTVSDRVTGLTWSLLDSHLDLGKCVSYGAAKRYVQNLNTGGYTDWRLPSAGELASIYKNKPFFPGTGAAWYWTSESFARGYHWVVDVVTSLPETVFTRTSKTEDSCGSVRAVRK